MNKRSITNSITVTAAILILTAAAGPVRADNASRAPVQAPKAATHSAQTASSPGDDFAGLDYSDEQKTEIEKIRQDSNAKRAIVAKDDKLAPEQKDAMLQGYTRLEYGRIFRVLTPVQQKQVRQRITARRAEEQAAHRKQPPAK